jgi:hypothetical protein
VCLVSHTPRIIELRAEPAETTDIIIGYHFGSSVSKGGARGGANMIIPQTPNLAEKRKRVRFKVARRVYQALVAQDPDRLITLRDDDGRVVARHDPRPEEDDPEIASSRP